MSPYHFSPIHTKDELIKAIAFMHFAAHKLCKQSFGKYLPNSGNVGIFCHYDEEYEFLTKLREELTQASDNINQKYFRLHTPIIIPSQDDVPETTYYYLYIRKPDPYRHHIGDIDFYLEQNKYDEIKSSLQTNTFKGMRIFPRTDLDMIELFDPDIDVLAYVSTHNMTEKVRTKTNS